MAEMTVGKSAKFDVDAGDDAPTKRKLFTFRVGHSASPRLLIILALLLIFGLIMLSSASSVVAFQNFDDPYYYLKHQLMYGVLLGGVVFFALSRIDYTYWRKIAFPLMVASLVLLLLVFIPGIGTELLGAKRWISVGGIFFQPSEVVKLTFLFYLAAWLETRGHQVKEMSAGLTSFLVMLGALVAIIAVAQKDLGTTIVLTVIALSVYFVAGAPWKHIGIIAGIGAIMLTILIKLFPFRAERLTVFLNPELDPQGIGYHINQALLAIGSGGLFGLGLGHSRQKFNYLPEAATDSIFAVIGEELGFFFSVMLIILFLAFVLEGLRIARNSPEAFGKYLAVGITSWIGFQALINISAMLSLVPLTGIPLPFISYGSSSLITTLAAVGILAAVSKQAAR
ncbi:MAG: putative lipid II flippase FtsW [Patescibacteria group bacterium]